MVLQNSPNSLSGTSRSHHAIDTIATPNVQVSVFQMKIGVKHTNFHVLNTKIAVQNTNVSVIYMKIAVKNSKIGVLNTNLDVQDTNFVLTRYLRLLFHAIYRVQYRTMTI